MVKKIVIVVAILMLAGCCFKEPYSSLGMARKSIQHHALQDTSIYNKIDTLSIYEFQYYELLDVAPPKRDYIDYKMFLRFFSDGKLSFGTAALDEAYTREDFNPASGRMGYFSMDEDGALLVEHFRIQNCAGKKVKGKIEIVGDTLYRYEMADQLLGRYDQSMSVYVKSKNIDPELLKNWTPDW